MSSIEHRLAALEREMIRTRRSARLAWSLLGAGAILGLLAAANAAVPQTVRAHRFEVVNDENKVVAVLAETETGGRIDLWNARGANTFRASSNEHGGDLAIWNATGRNVLGAFSTPQGAELAVYTMNGADFFRVASEGDAGILSVVSPGSDSTAPTCRIQADSAGASLTLKSNSQDAQLAIDAASLRLSTSDGTPRVSLQAQSDGSSRFFLADQQGGVAAQLESKPTGGGMLLIRKASWLQLALASTEGGGLLNLFDPQGHAVVAAGNAVDGHGGSLTVKNSDDVAVFRAGASADGAGEVSVYTADGMQKTTTTAAQTP